MSCRINPLCLNCALLSEVPFVKSRREQLVAALSFATTVGVTVVSNLAVGFYLGKWADTALDAYPWGRIGGILLGMITAVWSVYNILRRDYFNGTKG